MSRPPDRRRRLAAWLVFSLSAAAIVLVGLVVRSQGGSWGATRTLWLARGSGWAAVGALMISLSASPTGRLLALLRARVPVWPWTAALRRAFGIAAASLALLHAVAVLSGYLRGAWAALLTFSYLRVGVVALAILIALLATSFPPVERRLRRARVWKPLHRLAYVAALLALEHLLLSPFAPRAITIGLFAALVGFGLLRLLPRGSRPL